MKVKKLLRIPKARFYCPCFMIISKKSNQDHESYQCSSKEVQMLSFNKIIINNSFIHTFMNTYELSIMFQAPGMQRAIDMDAALADLVEKGRKLNK